MEKNKRYKQGFGNVIEQYQQMHKENQIFNVAREESVIVSLGLVIDCLVSDFWEESEVAKKEAPKLIRMFLSLYSSYLHGVVSISEIAEYIEEMSGIEIQLQHIKLTKEGKWKKVEALGEKVKEQERKTAGDYRREWEELTAMYEFSKKQLEGTINRKNISESKKTDAIAQMERFTNTYDSISRQIERTCFMNTGQILQKGDESKNDNMEQ